MKQRIKEIPVTKWLKTGFPDNYEFNLSPDIGNNIVKKATLKDIFNSFRQNGKIHNLHLDRIGYITKPFSDAIAEAKEQLYKDEIWNSFEGSSGTLVIQEFTFTFVVVGKPDGVHHYNLIVFRKDGSFIFYREQNESINRTFYNELFIPDRVKERIDIFYTTLILTLLFIKYAKVEVKELKSREKQHIFNCRYFNDSDKSIYLYNCTWFTDLVKGEGFKVRGHFRMQPYKDKKGLVWIDTFMKTGYTSKARKLLQV